MTKQPVLTDFPHTIFATAKRRAQAAIQKLRTQFTRSSLSGYATLFEDVLPAQWLAQIDPTPRQRTYGHLPVFWAWVAQILHGNASCTKAASLIQSWCRTLGLPIPKSGSAGYCLGRKRIQTSFLQQIDLRIQEALQRRISDRDLWRGHVLKAIDGTSVNLDDTELNQKDYPQNNGQKPGCGHPKMGLVGLVNLSHGGLVATHPCRARQHDASIAPQLLEHLEEGDLLMGDRAFCSYEFIARIIEERKGHILMRLHQARHRKLDWRKGKKVSPIERIVTWQRPAAPPAGSDLTKEKWEQLPATLTLRYIKLGYENRAGEKAALVVVTDLLNPESHPAEELADLYMERWQVELKFRDLKTTLGMEHLAVKTPEMARRTVIMMQIAYNLLRIVMQRAAHEAGERVNHLSVKGVLTCLTSSHESFRAVAGKPRKRRQLYEHLIEDCAGHTLDIRPYRQEPRAIKRRPKNYQMLTKHRHTFKEIPHREYHYRKPRKQA